MGELDYFILDIETCPLDVEAYLKLPEEEQGRLLNPIDSGIVAVGLRHSGENTIFIGSDEKQLLSSFWQKWKELSQKNIGIRMVGFNIANFDIPFLVTRSFINNVEILPFNVKLIVDLREKINAYRHGHSRGTLKDFAAVMGMKTLDVSGKDMARLWHEKQIEKIKEYLANDLLITEAMLKRMKELRIMEVGRG